MATGRTISASFLTKIDQRVIGLCESISNIVYEAIPNKKAKDEFNKEYGKISETRDGGLGLGGGKIQRDAICTRGRQGKAPFSNRNLRWHPLLVAEKQPTFAKKIENIEIKGKDDTQVFIFTIKDQRGKVHKYPSDKVHEIDGKYVALPEHWYPHIDILKSWSDTLWTQNSCVIPALEACNWWDSVETYATLGLAVAVDLYKADFKTMYSKIIGVLKKQQVDRNIQLPSRLFPTEEKEITKCPVCQLEISKRLDRFRRTERGATWQPAWRSSKKEEGDDSSIQIMHVEPLVENVIKHNASNVRYGHRWCNVSMTDHSLGETLDFMEFVVRAHKRCRQ